MRLLPFFLLAVLLQGCGGGSTPSAPVPVSSNASTPTPAVTSTDTSVQNFVAQVTPAMEAVLSARTGQRAVFFETSAEAAAGGVDFTAPDYIQRITVFELHYDGRVLSGRVLTEAERAAVEGAARRTLGVDIDFHIFVFPYGTPAYGLVNSAISNLQDGPVDGIDHLATQARLGESVWLLERSADGRYERVLMDSDGYLAWAPVPDVMAVTDDRYAYWKSAPSGMLNEPAAGLSSATRLPLVGDRDGTALLQRPDSSLLAVADALVRPRASTAAAVLEAARAFLPSGTQAAGPYLLGGTAGQQYDGSGYVQTVYRLCGIALPRDADEQQEFLPPVVPTLAQIDRLQPGDLVFFSDNGQYATHVAIYEADGKIIHCTAGGAYSGVKRSTLVGGDDYDASLQSTYFGAGRISGLAP